MSQSKDGYFTRREAVQITLASLGAGLVAAGCSKTPPPMNPAREEAATGPLFFSAEERVLLGEVAEIMIPTTETPGARAANVHGFIDRMMAQWARASTQAAFRTLLGEINSSAKRRFGADFMALTAPQRVEVVAALDAAAFAPEGAAGEVRRASQDTSRQLHTFRRLKGLVFLGYYQSEIGATQELQFKLVPGPYEACVPFSKIARAWAGEPQSVDQIGAVVRGGPA